MDRSKVKAAFILGILVVILAACSGEVTNAPIATLTPTITTATPSLVEFTSIPSATHTPIFPLSSTPNSTQQTWRSTAIAIKTELRATYEQARIIKETQIAQFSVDCDELDSYSTGISPDGNWIAASCGYSHGHTMVVKNKQGVEWVLDLKDFVIPEFAINGVFSGYGSLVPKFWSSDGTYLYFSAMLGYDGGGNQCFPTNLYRNGSYGLFRLNLNKGSWVTLLPPMDLSSVYGIRFSPTGQNYAVNMDGITIVDLNSGNLVQIDASEVMDLLWSPDGRYLAYSIANCGESPFARSAAVYIWDSVTNQARKIFATQIEKMLLYPEAWIDNSTLRVLTEKATDQGEDYEVYIIDVPSEGFTFWGTATPYK